MKVCPQFHCCGFVRKVFLCKRCRAFKRTQGEWDLAEVLLLHGKISQRNCQQPHSLHCKSDEIELIKRAYTAGVPAASSDSRCFEHSAPTERRPNIRVRMPQRDCTDKPSTIQWIQELQLSSPRTRFEMSAVVRRESAPVLRAGVRNRHRAASFSKDPEQPQQFVPIWNRQLWTVCSRSRRAPFVK